MHRNWIFFLGICSALLFSACEKEEIPIEKKDRGELITDEVFIETNYRYQAWYDLESGEVVKRELKDRWELAFDCDPSVQRVYLNSSLAMQAAPLNTSDFNADYDLDDLTFVPDPPSGNLDSLALRNFENGEVYLLDLGFEVNGDQRGYAKIQFLPSENSDNYRFLYSIIGSDLIDTVAINKDNQFNRVGFSITNGQAINMEPPKESFDLVFTQYMHVFYDPYQPYLVTGVLLNNHRVEAQVDSTSSLGDISRESIDDSKWSRQNDLIGYDWKSFDIDNPGAGFAIDLSKNYLVKSHSGFIYKLRFIDFYTTAGEKGNFVFEYQRL